MVNVGALLASLTVAAEDAQKRPGGDRGGTSGLGSRPTGTRTIEFIALAVWNSQESVFEVLLGAL